MVCTTEEKGEHVIAGCGKLHVEICLKDLPNKHNRLHVAAKPMDDALCKAISDFENKKSVQVAGLKECKDLAVQAVGVPGEAKPKFADCMSERTGQKKGAGPTEGRGAGGQAQEAGW